MYALKATKSDNINLLVQESIQVSIRLLLSIGLFFFSTHCLGQAKIRSLIVVEWNTDKAGKAKKHLVSYNFSKGNHLSKDTLYVAYQGNKHKFGRWFDYRDDSFIYKNRYAIGDRGSVYDLTKNKLMLDSSHSFLRTGVDSIFFYESETNKGGLWSLDLKSNNYVMLSSKIVNTDNRWSPDRKHYIQVPRSDINFKIKLFKTGDVNPTIIPTNGPYLNLYVLNKRIETYWLNNKTFLFANHAHSFPPLPEPAPKPVTEPTTDTIKIYDFNRRDDAINDVTIFKYSIDTHRSEKIAEIDSLKYSRRNAQFSTDSKDQLIYRTTNLEYYSLDLKKRKFTPYSFTALAEGFSLENKYHSDTGYILKYKRDEIGKVKNRKNYILGKYFAQAEEGSIWVWNAYSRSGRSFTVPKEFQIIGWVER